MFRKDILNLALGATTLFASNSANAQKEGKVMIELLGDDGEFKEHMPEQNDLPEFLKENDFMSPVLSWQQMLFGRENRNHPLV